MTNQELLNLYNSKTGDTEFYTEETWLQMNFEVNDRTEYYFLWSKPRARENKTKFYRMTVFSNSQVKPMLN